MFSAVECGQPKNGVGTVPVPAEVDLVYQNSYVYSCLPGNRPVSPGMSMVTRCLANATLSLRPPECTGIAIQILHRKQFLNWSSAFIYLNMLYSFSFFTKLSPFLF